MMRDTAARTASQSQTKRESSAGWFSFVRSAIVAGFEAYGSAQIGMCPSSYAAAGLTAQAGVSSFLNNELGDKQPSGCKNPIAFGRRRLSSYELSRRKPLPEARTIAGFGALSSAQRG